MNGFSRQVPVGSEVYLDHVGWFIPDVAAASAVLERLGFPLTPFVISQNADPTGGPPKPTGTGNRCAMLPRGYLELIAAVDGVDTPLVRQHRAALDRYTGIHVVAFTVADPSKAYDRLKAEGFAPLEPVLLRRPIRDSHGADTRAAFTVVRVPPEKMPEGRIQVLTQETPDLIWQDRLLPTENGVHALGGVLIVVQDPAGAAERYGRFLGRRPHLGRDYATLPLDRGRLALATSAVCRRLLPGIDLPDPPSIAAIGLVVKDLDLTRRFLARHAVESQPVEAGLAVRLDGALGSGLVLHESSVQWPPDPGK